MAKTTKELAEICNVSEQAIRSWCKRNNVEKERNESTKASYVIDEITETAIIGYYQGEVAPFIPHESNTCAKVRKETLQERKETTQEGKEATQEGKESWKAVSDVLKEQISSLQKQIDTLTEQLKKKDEQLTEKDKQIEQLTSTLLLSQQTQQDLTAALTSAQALHAGTIQRQLTVKEDKPAGFFKNFFRKKDNE